LAQLGTVSYSARGDFFVFFKNFFA